MIFALELRKKFDPATSPVISPLKIRYRYTSCDEQPYCYQVNREKSVQYSWRFKGFISKIMKS